MLYWELLDLCRSPEVFKKVTDSCVAEMKKNKPKVEWDRLATILIYSYQSSKFHMNRIFINLPLFFHLFMNPSYISILDSNKLKF
mgnify:CR=1 FL=1